MNTLPTNPFHKPQPKKSNPAHQAHMTGDKIQAPNNNPTPPTSPKTLTEHTIKANQSNLGITPLPVPTDAPLTEKDLDKIFELVVEQERKPQPKKPERRGAISESSRNQTTVLKDIQPKINLSSQSAIEAVVETPLENMSLKQLTLVSAILDDNGSIKQDPDLVTPIMYTLATTPTEESAITIQEIRERYHSRYKEEKNTSPNLHQLGIPENSESAKILAHKESKSTFVDITGTHSSVTNDKLSQLKSEKNCQKQRQLIQTKITGLTTLLANKLTGLNFPTDMTKSVCQQLAFDTPLKEKDPEKDSKKSLNVKNIETLYTELSTDTTPNKKDAQTLIKEIIALKILEFTINRNQKHLVGNQQSKAAKAAAGVVGFATLGTTEIATKPIEILHSVTQTATTVKEIYDATKARLIFEQKETPTLFDALAAVRGGAQTLGAQHVLHSVYTEQGGKDTSSLYPFLENTFGEGMALILLSCDSVHIPKHVNVARYNRN